MCQYALSANLIVVFNTFAVFVGSYLVHFYSYELTRKFSCKRAQFSCKRVQLSLLKSPNTAEKHEENE